MATCQWKIANLLVYPIPHPTYDMPPSQPLSARSTTAIRKQIVQESRPWEKAQTYLKAQEKKQEKVTEAQRKKTARTKA